jgi:ADP-ribosylation factor-like protein 8
VFVISIAVWSFPILMVAILVAFGFEQFRIKKLRVYSWDNAFPSHLAPKLHQYCTRASLVMFVIDAADRARFPLAKTVLDALLTNTALLGVPLLLVANKKDLDGASMAEIETAFALPRIRTKRTVQVIPFCATDSVNGKELRTWIRQVGKS